MKRLLILLLFLSTFTPYANQQIFAGNSPPETIYTNKPRYSYTFVHDASSFDYQLLLGNKVISTNSGSIKNIDKKVSTEIPLEFKGEGTYLLKLNLSDNVANVSQFSRTIIFDRTLPKVYVRKVFTAEKKIKAEITTDEEINLSEELFSKQYPKIRKGTHILTLVDSFSWNRKYEFQLAATDRSGNSLKIPKVEITTPKFRPTEENPFGADKDNPWGQNTGYSYEITRGNLNISVATGDLKFTNFRVRAPTLTYNERDPDSTRVYGVGLSKSNKLVLNIYLNYLSFNQAEKICNKSPDNRDSCFSELSGYDSIAEFEALLAHKCTSVDYFNCAEKFKNTPQVKFLPNFITNLKHVRISMQKYLDQPQEFYSHWQETKNEFKFDLDIKVLPESTYFFALTTVYGDLEVYGKSYSYKYDSEISNIQRVGQIGVEASSKCNGITCKLLPVEYINQYVNSKGKYEYWDKWQKQAGGQSCGAATAVMANNYFGNLSSRNNLKSYIFKDNEIDLIHKKCNRPGAFAVTAANSKCNMSSKTGITNYLKQFKLKAKTMAVNSQSIDGIKTAINNGNPVILSYKKPISHILLIIGYTYDDQLIVNDPYRDIQNNYKKGKYDYSGKNAIYSLLPNNKFKLNYLIEISKQ